MGIEQIIQSGDESITLGLVSWIAAALVALWLIQKLIPGFWLISTRIVWWLRCKIKHDHRWHRQERINRGRVIGVTLRCHICNKINDTVGVTFP